MEFKDILWGSIAFALSLALIILGKRFARGEASVAFSSLIPLGQFAPTWRTSLDYARFYVRLTALLLFCIALSRPQSGIEETRVSTEGIGIQLLVDRSSSMNEEMAISQGRQAPRIEVVRGILRKFLLGHRDSQLSGRRGDYIGLISFARFVDVNGPLVTQYAGLADLVSSIPLAEARSFEDGTAVGDAVAVAAWRLVQADEYLKDTFGSSSEPLKSKIIILLTDGMSNVGRSPADAAKIASENDIRIYSILIDSGEEWSRAKDDPFGLGGFLLGGAPQVNADDLVQISTDTGGRFYRAHDAGTLKKIYEEIAALEATETSQEYYQYDEKYSMWLWLGLLLLFFDLVSTQLVLARIS